MRKVLMLAALVAVAACDEPKPRPGKTAPAPPAAAAPPTAPEWAQGLEGEVIATAFPNSFKCEGYVDGPTERTAARVTIVGWSWIADAADGARRIVVADAEGKIVGFGEGGVARPDVAAARKDVTRPDVGFSAASPVTSGKVVLYGVDPAAKTACRLGEANL